MPLGILELLRRVGEDKVFVQNLIQNITNVRLKGRLETAITFVTGQQFLQPAHVMEPSAAPYVALVLWMPAELVTAARAAQPGGPMVRAKFQVITHEVSVHDGKPTKVVLEPRYDDTIPEDQRFAQATPWGRIEMGIDNPAAVEKLPVGKTFYVDFTEVEQAQA